MSIRTYGPNAVDWEQRVDLDRLRRERLARLNGSLEASSLGSLLTFDFANIRYMTSTHIGTWAMDKLIRFALLPRGGDPVVWDFGSAARHHQLFNPWLDGTERARLGRGEFFGEVSVILGESPIADVVAITSLRCLVLAGPRVEPFLIAHPRVMYRMLGVQARRLRAANRWRS